MAEISKAQKRQSTRNKSRYTSQFLTSIKNKVKKIARHVKRNPTDAVATNRLVYWQKDGMRTRKYTKRAG